MIVLAALIGGSVLVSLVVLGAISLYKTFKKKA